MLSISAASSVWEQEYPANPPATSTGPCDVCHTLRRVGAAAAKSLGWLTRHHSPHEGYESRLSGADSLVSRHSELSAAEHHSHSARRVAGDTSDAREPWRDQVESWHPLP